VFFFLLFFPYHIICPRRRFCSPPSFSSGRSGRGERFSIIFFFFPRFSSRKQMAPTPFFFFPLARTWRPVWRGYRARPLFPPFPLFFLPSSNRSYPFWFPPPFPLCVKQSFRAENGRSRKLTPFLPSGKILRTFFPWPGM